MYLYCAETGTKLKCKSKYNMYTTKGFWVKNKGM